MLAASHLAALGVDAVHNAAPAHRVLVCDIVNHLNALAHLPATCAPVSPRRRGPDHNLRCLIRVRLRAVVDEGHPRGGVGVVRVARVVLPHLEAHAAL